MIKIVLTYHSIGSCDSGEVGAGLYCVRESEFRAQVAHLAKNNMLRRTKDEGRRTYVPRPTSHVPRNTIAITFDDGLLNNYTAAYPILREFGLKAYFFILVSKVGTPGFMNWQQVKELKDTGMIIGSHGVTHRILTELDDKNLEYELRESKRVLEENLKSPVDSFSVPRGFYNEKVINAAKETGYKTIFTSSRIDNDGYKFGRIAVKSNWTLEDFKRALAGRYSAKERVGEFVKSVSKRVLGARVYDKMRTKVLSHKDT